ncbi:FAD/NAD(P)-binding domain-containing protein [Clavulina sp. PMI_390]|nr:FAD/NAD(P)-binding domain-containing protein [Clavulina sp. PMI_390]
MLFPPTLLWAFPLSVVVASASQQPLRFENDRDSEELYYQLPNEIRRVAVIGAGPVGLQFTSTLIKHGFEVRMFERAPNPGGVWRYTDKVPIPVSFPNRPIETMAYIPDVPDTLPAVRVYKDGDEGLTVDWRIREHWAPSPVWKNMGTTAPKQLMSLPDITYPKNTPWKHHQMDVTRHVRQYASSVGLNSNDNEHANVTAYWTRVERVEKLPGTKKRWTVTLRKLTPLKDGQLEVNWWQEEFDAVVVGNDSENDAAWVPPISGLDDWAHAIPEAVFHSRQYRKPEHYAGKNVLIIGGGFSGVGIANDLMGSARSVTVSTRKHPSSPLVSIIRGMFHKNVTHIPEIKHFDNRPSSRAADLRNASFTLANGTIVSGFDTIILATGHRRSLPYLVGYHNSTIKGRDEPETTVAPIITDGTHARSLHWTGHYIDDPTLVFCTDVPWSTGFLGYQTLGAARAWAGKARLPSIERMWKMYPGAANLLDELPITGQIHVRLFVTWLNNEILEFGGSFVSPPPIDEIMELAEYYTAKDYPPEFADLFHSLPPSDRPRSEWEVYNGDNEARTRPLSHHQLRAVHGNQPPNHWADPSLRW